MGRYLLLLLLAAQVTACSSSKKLTLPPRTSTLTGSAYYQQAAAMAWQQRDSFALLQLLGGDIPPFLTKLVPVPVSIFDSATQKEIHAVFFVAPDYLSIGTADDWARTPITPMAAQRVADTLHCFLPTRKMVDAIYKAAKVKLEPVPLYALRDSTPTFWHHHLIIEGQRKGRKGLIAGIKKDVVISGKISRDRPDRVAIYGWHHLDGKPIQPLYTGHIHWWVDYSHGIRLVYRKIKVERKWMDYTDVLKDSRLSRLLCDEDYCDFYRYEY